MGIPTVKNRIYHFANIALFFVTATIGGYGAYLYYQDKLTAMELGVNIISLSLGGASLIYSAAIYWVIQRRSERNAALVALVLYASFAAAVVLGSSDSVMVLLGLWLLAVALSGIFGAITVLVFISVSLANLLLLMLLGKNIDLSINYFAATAAVATVSYFIWRTIYLKPSSNKAPELSGKLLEEQLQSKHLIDVITDGVLVVDSTLTVKMLNPAGSELTGWDIKDATGIDVRSVLKLTKHEGKDEIELSQDEHPFVIMLRSGKPIPNQTYQLISRDNKGRYDLSISISPILSEDNKIAGGIAIFRDISAEKQQERQRTEFISTASHEMRTPVAAIEGYLALALNEKVCKIDTKARSYLDKAHDSTQHLGDLFRDLLAASKSEDGRLENHPKVIELGEYIEKIVDDFKFSAQEKSLNMQFLVAAQTRAGSNTVIRPLAYVYADPERIREALSNLINNAIKFTAEGSISVGLRDYDNYVQLSVSDTGPGIPKTDIPHLFQKFYRVDNSATRTIGGTGLGLYLTRRIVELYKGQIWVESEVGKGSTFYINLPRLPTQQAEELKQKEQQSSSPLDAV